ncbi:hypothetical protein BIFGAL_04380 [Bifidobacterium gallicum DSM 20093 = LMG 11596]|uniref:Uncharacterized protein n=1 Tax=Bifidobacterium gallicum DSM 20093 = LMG 11596 TaxID=561180 RepID=D1NWX3_9BIFI|nr:hypothetical protein BIFGAL_04380 [Bifidobacterium gallicum DSM 20093 = LMG 11596]
MCCSVSWVHHILSHAISDIWPMVIRVSNRDIDPMGCVNRTHCVQVTRA